MKRPLMVKRGLTKALDFHPDILFLDVMMPGKNGYEVCQEIRRTSGFEKHLHHHAFSQGLGLRPD